MIFLSFVFVYILAQALVNVDHARRRRKEKKLFENFMDNLISANRASQRLHRV